MTSLNSAAVCLYNGKSENSSSARSESVNYLEKSAKKYFNVILLLGLRFFYPDWGFTTLTEVFYPDWGFITLTEVYVPWLRFYYPDWGFCTLTEVFVPRLRFYYPDWGFSTLTEVFPCFFLSCEANARVKDGARPALLLIFVLFYVLMVLWRSLCCLCVYVYCTTATGWLPNCS